MCFRVVHTYIIIFVIHFGLFYILLFYFLDKEEAINIQTLIKAKPKFCRHCDVVVLNTGIRKKLRDMPFLTKEEKVGGSV